GLFTQTQQAGTSTIFGTGIVRVVGGPSTITGNVDLRAGGGTQFFAISVDTGSSLGIDGVIYGSNNATSAASQHFVKLGGGTLGLRGANSATVIGSTPNPVTTYTGNTSVIDGTLLLNKTGTAILGTLTIGDGRGADGSDVLQYGPLASNDTVTNGAAVN